MPEVEDFLLKWKGIFSLSRLETYGYTSSIEHNIWLKDYTPLKQKYRRMPYVRRRLCASERSRIWVSYVLPRVYMLLVLCWFGRAKCYGSV